LEGGGVKIKGEVENVAVFAACRASCESHGDARGATYHNRCLQDLLTRINHWADMAEAALAYVEWQIDNGVDVPMDGATYIRERGKLWDAFMVARGKSKGVEQ
jgi:hypothetical protein